MGGPQQNSAAEKAAAEKAEAERKAAEEKAAAEKAEAERLAQAKEEADKAAADAEAERLENAEMASSTLQVIGPVAVLPLKAGGERYVYRGTPVGEAFTEEGVAHAISVGLVGEPGTK